MTDTWEVEGGVRIPVRNAYAIGWNYPEHNREMGRQALGKLVVFQKSTGALLANGGVLPYPEETEELHYEGELVVLVGEGGARIPPAEAASRIAAYAAGIDFTRRDLQREAKAKGEPWFAAKNFAGATAVGPFVAASRVEPIGSRRLALRVNGELRQESLLSAMLRPAPELVSLVSRIVPLLPGDILFTGTPSGVGPVSPGDLVLCEIDGLPALEVRIGPRESL
ncbi:MAG: fumarylacetoacetate hydrolase family protein [Planctomycetes bacterium]|nr:fumarylacetoacetate hydrolase family protein [Planctomycetota bacterium]